MPPCGAAEQGIEPSRASRCCGGGSRPTAARRPGSTTSRSAPLLRELADGARRAARPARRPRAAQPARPPRAARPLRRDRRERRSSGLGKWRAAEAATRPRSAARSGHARPRPGSHTPRRARRARRPRRARRSGSPAAPGHAERRDGGRRPRGARGCWADRVALAQLRARRRGGSTGSPAPCLLAEALAALDRAPIEAGEAEEDRRGAAEALAFDPAELERVEARLFDCARWRASTVEPDELPARRCASCARLDAIEAGEGGCRAHGGGAGAAAYRGGAERSRSARRGGGAARRGGGARAGAAQARRARFRHRGRRGRAGAARADRSSSRGLDQPRRAVRPADQDRLGRRAVALHPRRSRSRWPRRAGRRR